MLYVCGPALSPTTVLLGIAIGVERCMGRLRWRLPVHAQPQREARADSAPGEGGGEHGLAVPMERLRPHGQHLHEADGEPHRAPREVRHPSADHGGEAAAGAAHGRAQCRGELAGDGGEGGGEEHPGAGEGAAAVPAGGRRRRAQAGKGRRVGNHFGGEGALRY